MDINNNKYYYPGNRDINAREFVWRNAVSPELMAKVKAMIPNMPDDQINQVEDMNPGYWEGYVTNQYNPGYVASVVAEPVTTSVDTSVRTNDNVVDNSNRTGVAVETSTNNNVVDTSQNRTSVVSDDSSSDNTTTTQIIVIDQSGESNNTPVDTIELSDTSSVDEVLGVGGISGGGGGGGDIMDPDTSAPVVTVAIPKGITVTGWVYPYPFIAMTLAGGGIGYYVARRFKQPLVAMLALIAAGLMAASAIGMKTFPPVKKVQ
jgi:hypothetical protein